MDDLGFWTADLETEALRWCASTHRLLRAPDALKPDLPTFLARFPGQTRQAVHDALLRAARANQALNLFVPILTFDGEMLTVEVRGGRVSDMDNMPVICGTLRFVHPPPRVVEPADITASDLRDADAATLLREIIDAMPSGVIVFDRDEHYLAHNKAYEELFPALAPALRPGTTLAGMLAHGIEVGAYAPEISPIADRRTKLEWVNEKLRGIRETGPSREVPLGDGRWIQLRERRSAAGNLVCVRTDITRLKHAEAEAMRRASEDPLTGLANRRVLFERIEASMNTRRKGDQGSAFALFDIDHFKRVNDEFGHDAGDRVLIEIARRAVRCLRDTDLIARLGGDEFAMVLDGVTTSESAERFLSRFLAALKRPIDLDGHAFVPSLSLGMVFFPVPGQTINGIYKAADAALYEVKRNGRNGWRLIDGPVSAQQVSGVR